MRTMQPSFNPCFYGSCSRRRFPCRPIGTLECSFNPCFYGSCSRSLGRRGVPWAELEFQSLFLWILLSKYGSLMSQNASMGVSILVFMDLALEELLLVLLRNSISPCFNPCFYGSCSRSSSLIAYWPLLANCFNPCFYGSCSRSPLPIKELLMHTSSFNPCFYGSCSRRIGPSRAREH